MDDVCLRAGEPADIPFIKSSWLHSFKSSHYAGPLPSQLYFHVYSPFLDYLIQHSQVLVACLPDAPEQIYGYLVYQPGLIHYCFVKEIFRRRKIASQMLQHVFPSPATQPPFYSFKTPDWSKFKLWHLEQPWAAYFKPSLARAKYSAPSPLKEPAVGS